MQIIAVLFCGFMHLRYLCRKKSLEMGMIIKDLCPHIVHKKDFSVHKTLYFSNVQHLGVDWIWQRVGMVRKHAERSLPAP